jgi:hypothetical protein
LLPVLPAVVCLLVAGWSAWLPAAGRLVVWRRRVWQAVSLGVLVAGWLLPLGILAPVYARPQPLQGRPEVVLGARFGEVIELAGYMQPDAIQPGDTARVRLCWQALRPMGDNYSVRLDVVGPDGQGYGRLMTYPGRGNFPASFWTPGQLFCDEYHISTGPALPAPGLAVVQVALLTTHNANGDRLPVVLADGRLAEAAEVPLPVLSTGPAPEFGEPVDFRFGDFAALRGYELRVAEDGETARVRLRWQVLRAVPTDYIIFVHLRSAPDEGYAQGDSRGLGGRYPTGYWQAGQVLEDEHLIDLPPGTAPPLSLYVGLYDPVADERVPVFANGEPLPNAEVLLADGIRVAPGLTIPARP